LDEEVGAATRGLEKPTTDEIEESKLPEKIGTSYRAMYAHGMHFRIKFAEDDKVTTESGVSAVVWRRNRARAQNRGGHLESAKYVDWIEEILELDYHSHCCVLLVCSWIPVGARILIFFALDFKLVLKPEV
jgi:hypothetical protein